MLGFKLDEHGVVANAMVVENEYWAQELGLVPEVVGVWIGDKYPEQYTEGQVTQQKVTDLELGNIEQGQRMTDLELSIIAQGQAVTDLELMILGGT